MYQAKKDLGKNLVRVHGEPLPGQAGGSSDRRRQPDRPPQVLALRLLAELQDLEASPPLDWDLFRRWMEHAANMIGQEISPQEGRAFKQAVNMVEMATGFGGGGENDPNAARVANARRYLMGLARGGPGT
jgi:hypothetical protein